MALNQKTRNSILVIGVCALLACGLGAALGFAQGHDDNPDFPAIPWDHPAIQYADTEPNDPVARLQKQLDAGPGAKKLKWDYDAKLGYLPAILKALDINVDSQMLVFSRTSAQVGLINMETPRAIYFNDHSSVGYVQRSHTIELTSIDPKLGAIFYTFDNSKPDAEQPQRLAFAQQSPLARMPYLRHSTPPNFTAIEMAAHRSRARGARLQPPRVRRATPLHMPTNPTQRSLLHASSLSRTRKPLSKVSPSPPSPWASRRRP